MEDLKDKTIGVFFGGQSPEHEISIITGEFIIAELKKMGLNVSAVYVDKEGAWYSNEEVAKLKFFKEGYHNALKELSEQYLHLGLSKKRLALQARNVFKRGKKFIEFIFPAFHGRCGEDGAMQGLAEFFQTPYAGCGIYTSSIAIDKDFTKKMFKKINIPTTEHITVHKKDFADGKDKAIKKIQKDLGLPVFIKPSRAGSSIGITKVKKEEDIADALELACHYDPKVVIEKSVENVKDITCAVLSDGEQVIVSEVQEALFSADLFDYDLKYLEGGGAQTGNAESNLAIPAKISKEHTEKVKDMCKTLFREVEANGTMRVDFLMNRESGEIFANEINTLPGTLYHHLWKKSDVEINTVLEMMLKDGMRRWKESQEMHSEFTTDVLKSANSAKLQQ